MESFKGDLHNDIMREYEFIRANNEAAQKNNKEQVYHHFPRIKEIDEELSKISLIACRKMLNSGANHEEIIKNMQTTTEKLVKEKVSILKNAGIPANFMDEVFSCPKCQDKGSYNNKWCECYYEKLQKYVQKKSNINANTMHSFDKFDISLYPDVVNQEYGVSPRDVIKNIYNVATRYANLDPAVPKQLLFYGSTGLGKTFTSECIAREFIKNGKSVYYTSAPRLFSTFEDYKFGKSNSAEAKRIIDYIQEVDLLIIDDLGTEFRTQYTDSILFDLINTRTNENKHMIISTNLSPMQIEPTYSQRISSRILGNFEVILFLGNDLRINK